MDSMLGLLEINDVWTLVLLSWIGSGRWLILFHCGKMSKATYVKEVVRLHGIPKSITLDQHTKFMSHFCQTSLKRLGTELKFTSAYHPQIDGHI